MGQTCFCKDLSQNILSPSESFVNFVSKFSRKEWSIHYFLTKKSVIIFGNLFKKILHFGKCIIFLGHVTKYDTIFPLANWQQNNSSWLEKSEILV
jgi:hypothetical protein